MTNPLGQQPTVAAGPAPTVAAVELPPAEPPPPSGSVAGQAVPIVPDDTVMIDEIDQDRRHERYLVRAAFVASVVIAIALAIRMVWG